MDSSRTVEGLTVTPASTLTRTQRRRRLDEVSAAHSIAVSARYLAALLCDGREQMPHPMAHDATPRAEELGA